MTRRNGSHCYGFRCPVCGKPGSGYASESAAAKAERRHFDSAPSSHLRAITVKQVNL